MTQQKDIDGIEPVRRDVSARRIDDGEISIDEAPLNRLVSSSRLRPSVGSSSTATSSASSAERSLRRPRNWALGIRAGAHCGERTHRHLHLRICSSDGSPTATDANGCSSGTSSASSSSHWPNSSSSAHGTSWRCGCCSVCSSASNTRSAPPCWPNSPAPSPQRSARVDRRVLVHRVHLGIRRRPRSRDADSWRMLLASSAVPALVVLILRMALPESPRWLQAQGRTEEAQAIISAHYGPQYGLPPAPDRGRQDSPA